MEHVSSPRVTVSLSRCAVGCLAYEILVFITSNAKGQFLKMNLEINNPRLTSPALSVSFSLLSLVFSSTINDFKYWL